METHSKYKLITNSFLLYATGLFAVTFYTWIVLTHAINMPKWDDFQEVLSFMDRWLEARTIQDHLIVLFSRTNEHILLVNHIIVLLQYAIVGQLDFSWLIYIGNLFYIGTAVTFWLFFRAHAERAWVFCIIMLGCVTFYPYDSTLWAMTSISNQAVIFFAALAIYFATRQAIHFPALYICTFLSVFSQSNGLLILPVVAALLYEKGNLKNFHRWILFSIITIAIYATAFNIAKNVIPGGADESFQVPYLNILLLPLTLLATFGGVLFSKADTLPFILSLMVGIIILINGYRQRHSLRENKAMLSLMTFLFMSILLIVCARGISTGPSVAFTSRYKMYPAAFFILSVMLSPALLSRISQDFRIRVIATTMMMVFCGWSYFLNLGYSRLIDGDLKQSLQRWVEDGDFRRVRGFFVRDADSYLFAALENNTWSPMVLIDPEQRLPAPARLESCPAITPDLAEVRHVTMISHKNPNAAGIRVDPPRIEPDSAGTLILCSDDSSYRIDVPAHTSTSTETFYYLPREGIQPGNYQVYWKDDNEYLIQGSPFINKKNTR